MAKSKQNNGRARTGQKAKRLLAALIIFAGAWAVIWMATGSPAASVDYSDKELIARGGGLFARHCAACHGIGAAGENPRYLKGGGKPGGSYWAPALNGTAHAWHHPPDALFKIIKDGSPAGDSPMRGWGDKLAGGDIHALLAYLQSLWPEAIRLRYQQAFKGN